MMVNYMDSLHFYSSNESKYFLTYRPEKICFLGACTARNLSLGIDYFSNSQIKTFSPYETIFNAPSLLKDLEVIALELDHHILIDSKQKVFYDEIRFWNKSESYEAVLHQNLNIDNYVKTALTESDLLILSLGSVEMWSKVNHIMNRLPKNQFLNPEIKNVYLSCDDILNFAKQIMRVVQLINPKIKIQFSIPYVLLKASEKFHNLHLTTTENYRIIKEAIMELGDDYYFPEYELFKYYVEKNNHPFQEDGRHPSVKLIADISKHIVKEINKDYLLDIPNKPFAINKVDSRGKINGKEYL